MPSRYQWFNPKFTNNIGHFCLQALLITVFMFCVLLSLMYGRTGSISILTAIGATSVASSIFVVFALPGSSVALPHRVIGGYVIGILAGISWHYAALSWTHFFNTPDFIIHCVAGGCAAGTAMLVMGLLDFQHPPTMGLALGLVMDQWDDRTLIVVVVAVLVMCLIKWLLRRWLLDLI